MNLKTKKTICLIVGMVSILTIVGAISYAYFTSLAEMRPSQTVINTSTVSATFADYGLEVGGELNFGDTIVKKFTIQNTGTVDASVKMYWKGLINTYQEGSLTYSLSYSEEENGTYENIIVDKNVPISANSTKKVLKDILTIPVNETYYYNLSITLNYLDDVNQDADLNASFNSSFDLVDSNYGQIVTLTFNPGSGTVSDNTLSIVDGEAEGELPSPTLYGYDFKGWYLDEGYENQLTSNMISTLSTNQTVYAKWEPKVINVTFDAGEKYLDGDSNLKQKVVQVVYGQTYGKFPVMDWLLHLSYWEIVETGKRVSEGSTVTIAEDHTIMAHYTECFLEGTQVYTPSGYVSVENLNIGDNVYSYNETTKKIEVSALANTFKRKANKYLKITLQTGEIVNVTPDHPFYDREANAWKAIKNFKVNDRLMDSNGDEVKIESIEMITEEVFVYNLNVSGNHNYFVTKDNILVHNKVD